MASRCAFGVVRYVPPLILAACIAAALLWPSREPSSVRVPPRVAPAPFRDEDLAWAVQVTDIHVSVLFPQNAANLRRFCGEVLPVVRPRFVLATGDLVNSVPKKGSIGQSEAEWRTYRAILEEYGVANRSYWHEVLGNHDQYMTTTRDPREKRYNISLYHASDYQRNCICFFAALGYFT
eukprot:m51a1_g5600 hypothetical protein (179) ;mRNA; r:693123-695128